MTYECTRLDAVRTVRARQWGHGQWLRSAKWSRDRKLVRIDTRAGCVVLAEPQTRRGRSMLVQLPLLRTLPEDVRGISAREANREGASDAA